MENKESPLTKAKIAILTLGLAATLTTSQALGAVAFRHSGNTDPTLENFPIWTLNTNGDPSGYSVGPAPNNENAWRVEGTGGSRAVYNSGPLTSADPKQGWRLTVRLKIEDDDDSLEDHGVYVQFGDGATNNDHLFRWVFGSDTNGNAQVGVTTKLGFDSVTVSPDFFFTTSGPGDHGYHTYQWVWTPGNEHGGGAAKMFIDGQFVPGQNGFGNDIVWDGMDTVFSTTAAERRALEWGTFGNSSSIGAGLFNFLQLETGTVFDDLELPEIIPEPASLAILAAGGLLLTRRRSGRSSNN